jgi:Ca2+-binding RTX toxin-like protein
MAARATTSPSAARATIGVRRPATTLVAGGTGNDTVAGGEGADAVFGGQGDDVVEGGAGDDSLSGDRGNDSLAGGAGDDVFVFNSDGGADVIVDFATGDVLQIQGGINGLDLSNPSDLLSLITSDSLGNAVINLGDGNSVTLLNLTEADLKARIESVVVIV